MLLSLEMLMSGLGSRQHRASSLHVTPSLTNLIGGAEDIQRHLTFDRQIDTSLYINPTGGFYASGFYEHLEPFLSYYRTHC